MKTVPNKQSTVKTLFAMVAGIAFVLAVPLVLVITNVQIAFNSLWLYEYGFERYQVSVYTGIPKDHLIQASEQLVGFFNSQDEFPEIRVLKGGQDAMLFNSREIQHLIDVRDLLNRSMLIRAAASLYIIAYILAIMFLFKRRGALLLSSQAMKSGIGSVAVLVIFAVASLAGFDQLFLQFHLISFSNDLWMLNPSTDYLLMMFPQGFWFDATMLVGLATGIQALILFWISKVCQTLVRT